jgi:serine/threonine protein kinase
LFQAVESLHSERDRLAELKREMDGSSEVSPEVWDELRDLTSGGFLHRDLMPANVLVLDRTTWRVKLIDVQLASAITCAKLSQAGTPASLPPDWGSRRWDMSFDLYGLACILFACSTGTLPEPGKVAEQLAGAVSDPGDRDGVARFFHKALAPSADDRYREASEMRADWEGARLAFQ